VELFPVVQPVGVVEAAEVATLGLVLGYVYVFLDRSLAALRSGGVGELVTAVCRAAPMEAPIRRTGKPG
jgi:hypothetical protein